MRSQPRRARLRGAEGGARASFLFFLSIQTPKIRNLENLREYAVEHADFASEIIFWRTRLGSELSMVL